MSGSPSRLITLSNTLTWIRTKVEYAVPINFITLHYAYFILTCLISGIIFWGSSTPPRSVSFTDSIFLTVSAMTGAGLNTINLSTLNTFQQFLLFLLMMLGSPVLVSAIVVHVRRRAFEKRFTHIVEEQRRTTTRSRGRSFNSLRPSWSISNLKMSQKKPAEEKPEVDGVVVRGRAMPIVNTIDQTITVLNPGNHVRAEIQNGEAAVEPIARSIHQPNQTESPSKDEPSHNSTSESSMTGEEPEANARPDITVSTGPKIRFAEQGAVKQTITSPGQRSVHSKDITSPRRPRLFSLSGVGALPDLMNHPSRAPSHLSALSGDYKTGVNSIADYFQMKSTSRNSQFSMLSREQREKLGGVEYLALRTLEVIVLLYFVLFQMLGCIGVGAWIALNDSDVAASYALNPWWAGAFNAVSAFNNSGMSLLDANMVLFQGAYYLLVTMALLILAGNTCYALILRLIIWTLWKIMPDTWTNYKLAFAFILKHPRRVYTNLFPAYHTWYLLATVIVLNSVDWVAFEILNIGNPYVESLPVNNRVIDGLFQAIAVRCGGFAVVPIGSIAIGVQVLYVLMMYISVYPVSMTIRSSNVYEERSLGIYVPGEDDDPTDDTIGPMRRQLTNNTFFADTGTHSRSYFVRQQIRSQLAHDLWWISLAVLLIVIIEGSQYSTDPISYSVFNIVLEVVSAYACVGIPVGLPDVLYSFCGGWHVLSKLTLCAVMIRGRHRGLPVAIDRAVLLPSESLARAEEEDAKIKADGAFSRSRADTLFSPGILRRRVVSEDPC